MSKRRFLFVVLLFLIVSLIIDRAGAVWLGYRYMLSNEKAACAYSVDSCCDVVILGSSRAHYHYNPYIIDSISGLSCYNYGSSGKNIIFDYAILSLLMEKDKKPKVCLLEVFYKDIVVAEKMWELGGLSSLFPLYGKNSGVDSVLYLMGEKEIMPIIFSHTYRYNTRIISFLRDVAIGPKDCNNGFESVDGMIDEPISSLRYNSDYNETKIFYLNKFVEKCKDNDVKCILCISPMFFDNKPSLSKMYEPLWNIAQSNDVQVWDDSYSELFLNDSTLFRDHHHLNKKGVEIYSKIIAERLKKLHLNY